MHSACLVSVIVPTHNRLNDLLETLQSLFAQEHSQLEVLVIDNRSTDGTAEVVQGLALHEPRLRYLYEDQPGVNVARNRGCLEASGDLLAFLDDDEVASPDWLTRLLAAMDETGAGGVGGPYQPLWQASPPRWLLKSRCMQETLSFMDFGEARAPVEWLLGGNALYTRAALLDANYFGVAPGRIGASGVTGGGDISVGRRVRSSGHSLWFEPSAVVYHKVPPERMRLPYILRRAFWSGYNDIAIGRQWEMSHKAVSAVKRGPDAIALGMVILPGILWGRLQVKLGRLHPQPG
ncbi:MAG: glycosyltransferase family 2 protein [Armatimonadia bacterium]